MSPEGTAKTARSGDVEKATGTGSGSAQEGGSSEKDGSEFIVKWDGPDDPGCPLNTPTWRKWYVYHCFF